MIRIGLLSEDHQMHLMLSTGMGKDFRIFRESIAGGIEQQLAASDYDVIFLDLATKKMCLPGKWSASRHCSPSVSL